MRSFPVNSETGRNDHQEAGYPKKFLSALQLRCDSRST